MKCNNHKDQFPLRQADILRAKFREPVFAWHYILLIRRAVVLWNKCYVCVCVCVYTVSFIFMCSILNSRKDANGLLFC